jgi:hypothetical protein
MNHDRQGWQRVSAGLLLLGLAAGFGGVGCSDIRPESDVEESGMIDSPTHEQDTLREAEGQQRQNRSRNGGGGY